MNALTGAETGFRRCGHRLSLQDRGEMARREAWLEHARPYQLDSRLLSRADLRSRLYPAIDGRVGGRALHAERRARRAQPRQRRRSPRRRAGSAPPSSRDCAVRGIETTAGRVSAAVTEKGRIACERVVLAGGVWSRLFCGNLGAAAAAVPRRLRGDAHRDARRRAGHLGRGRRLRVPQAPRRRLHGGELEQQPLRSHARRFALLRRFPPGAPARAPLAAAAHRPPLHRRVADETALGARRGDAVRARAHARPRAR